MKLAVPSVVFMVSLAVTCYYREALGSAFVWMVLIFGADLAWVGIYYLQLQSEE